MSIYMNYWVTPTGKVYEGDFPNFHLIICNKYLVEHPLEEEKVLEWIENKVNSNRYVHEYFEEILKWVRYTNIGLRPHWVISDNQRLTKKQKEKIFELTGDFIE